MHAARITLILDVVSDRQYIRRMSFLQYKSAYIARHVHMKTRRDERWYTPPPLPHAYAIRYSTILCSNCGSFMSEAFPDNGYIFVWMYKVDLHYFICGKLYGTYKCSLQLLPGLEYHVFQEQPVYSLETFSEAAVYPSSESSTVRCQSQQGIVGFCFGQSGPIG